tara:strand:+ start:261 stop:518 length:258 start_codon:yes stop_codon:yes gene_type:complete
MSIVVINTTKNKKRFKPFGCIKILIKEKKDKIIRFDIQKDNQLIYVLKNSKLIKSVTDKRTKKLENCSIKFDEYSSPIRNANIKN